MRWKNLIVPQELKPTTWGETKQRDELPALRWFACWHDLKWSLRLPPQFMTQNIKHFQKPQPSCSTCNSETISHVDFTVDCCDLSENIWPDRKFFFALEHVLIRKNWASTTMFSCHTSIFQSMDHFKCRQKASRSQAKSSRKVHVYATVSFSLPSGKSNMSSTPFPGSHPKHTHLAWKCPFASDSLIPLMTN